MNFIRPGEADHVIKSIRDPGRPTLRQAIEGMDDNVFEAARREQVARSAFQALMPGDAKEPVMKGWEQQARAEQAHWREYLAVYRLWMSLHPELADKPIGTRCSHGYRCSMDSPLLREVGADDDGPPPARNDRRLPPERDLEDPANQPPGDATWEP